MSSESTLKIFGGTSNPQLVAQVCAFLDLPEGRCRHVRFSDGEMFFEIEENVRGADTFVIQSTCNPANENLMELLIMVDALRRASARSICVVFPYFGYARQDRKVSPRTPITAKLVADLVSAAGVSRVLALDLHAAQIQGFFNLPFDHVFARPVLLSHMARTLDLKNAVMVSPDAGGVERARAYAKRLGTSLAIIDKRRPAPNVAEIMNIIGEVKGREAVILDDMIDTAGTLAQAAHALSEQGARRIVAYASHGVFSGPALARLAQAPLERVVVTDSIPLGNVDMSAAKLEVLSVAPLLAKALRRIHLGESVSSLFV